MNVYKRSRDESCLSHESWNRFGRLWSDSERSGEGVLQLKESRRSFRRQVEQLKDIDDKAMRSVRTAAVIIGFVVTAVGITLRTGRANLGLGPALFTGLGVFFLTLTVIAGVGTHSTTEYRNQLTDVERARLEGINESSPRRNAELIRIYYSWLESTKNQITEQGTYLSTTLFALLSGVLSLLTAASLAVIEWLYSVNSLTTFQIAVIEIGTSVLVIFGVLVVTRLLITKMKVGT